MPSNMFTANTNKDSNIQIENINENPSLIPQELTTRNDLAINMVTGALIGIVTTALISWNEHNWWSQMPKELTFASSQTLAREILGGLVGATAGVIYNYAKQWFCADNDVEQFYPSYIYSNIDRETSIQIENNIAMK